MIQFLRIDTYRLNALRESGFVETRSQNSSVSYQFVSKFSGLWFFIKRVIALLLIVYATLFLAVSIPFFKLPFIPVYFFGSMVIAFFCLRFFNHLVKYFRFKGGCITVEFTDYFLQKKAPAEEADNSSDQNDDRCQCSHIENHHRAVTRIKIKHAAGETVIPADEVTYLEYNLAGNLLFREKYLVTSIPLILIPENDRDSLLSLFQDMAPKRTAGMRKVWEFFDAITVALLLAVHVIQFIVQAYYIPSPSMEDTLKEGDQLFVEKITYGPAFPKLIFMDRPVRLNWISIREVQRGDVVIFNPPHEEDKDYIKRCIAVAGDRLEIKNGIVLVNETKINEPYTRGMTIDDHRMSKIQGIVPPGKIVVMGDNRENSQDSRFFGYLDVRRVKGRALLLYFNWNDIKNLKFNRLGLIR